METTKTNSGMTLIEMMVTIAVSVILSVCVAAYMYQNAKMTKNSERQGNLTKMQVRIMGSSSKPDTLLNSEKVQ